MAKKNNNDKVKEALLIALCVTVIVAICTGLIFLVLHFAGDPDDHAGEEDTGNYPTYTSPEEVKTEGAYYNTENTGVGVAVDMEKVAAEIDAYEYSDFAESKTATDFVAIRINNYGDIVLALRSDIAPETVANFKKLVENDFYNNTLIHRVKKDILVQGGIYDTQEEKKESDMVKGEFTQHGFVNNLTHIKGVVSMARSSATNRDSASSEFFIVQGTEVGKDFDTLYASFAYVVAGMDVIDKIAEVEVKEGIATSEISRPKGNIVIKDVFFVEPKEGTGLGTETKFEYTTHTLTIKDDAGAPANVTVKIVNNDNNLVYANDVTGEDGKAEFKLPEGNYRVEILNTSGYLYESRYDFQRAIKIGKLQSKKLPSEVKI